MRSDFRGWLALATLLATVCGCDQKERGAQTKGVLSPVSHLQSVTDNRLLQSIGFLVTADGAECTAFVTGPDEVTAAAHCRGKHADAGAIDATFTTEDGRTVHLSKVKRLETKKDYMVLSADSYLPLGLEYGSLENGPVEVVGYDFNRKGLYAHSNCTIDGYVDAAGVFLHSCDTEQGFSGGPVLQHGKVVGIHLGYQGGVDRNVGFDLTKIDDDSVDVAAIGIKDECLFDCHIRNVVPNIPSPSEIFDGVVKSLAGPVAGAVAGKAESNGWNKANCIGVGAGAIVLAAGTVTAPACTAAGVATAGIGLGVCIAAVDGAIVAATCTQLCVDHHLSDCK
jgi:V8-like Glu-specific endopeptidase